jgi:HNH endonuclease
MSHYRYLQRLRRDDPDMWVDTIPSTCNICDEIMEDADDVVIDHIVPRARTDRADRHLVDDEVNLQFVHSACNQRKGDRLGYREEHQWCEVHQEDCDMALWWDFNDDGSRREHVKCLDTSGHTWCVRLSTHATR